MSDNYLHLIPIDHNYVPSPERIQQALELISSIWRDVVPEVSVTDVKFVHSGTNLESISCPNCGAKLDFVWWGEAMNRAYSTDFHDLSIRTPCCGYRTNLNDLQYYWPAGFARFRISFLNPRQRIDDEMIRHLARILGGELRKVWAHF